MSGSIIAGTISWRKTVPVLSPSQARALALADQIRHEDHEATERGIKSGDYAESNAISGQASELFQSLVKTQYYREAVKVVRGERIG